MVVKHLVIGYGPDTPPNLAFSYTESVYVTILLRGGLPLLFLYAGLMVALALQARDLRNDPDVERRVIAQVLFLLIILTVFMQLITNYFVNAGFPFLFWVLAGLLMGGTGEPGTAPVDDLATRRPGERVATAVQPSSRTVVFAGVSRV